MASKARKAFDRNVKNVDRLFEIHEDLGGTGRGRRYQLEVLNMSAIVFITAFWEAYCEDLAAEALDHLVKTLPDAAGLPKELKKQLAKDIAEDKHDLAMWALADTGWKDLASARLKALTEQRNFDLNTPKSKNIDDLMMKAIGLPAASKSWAWKGMSAENARKKLDAYVTLRGGIAHRGSGGSSCTKQQAADYFSHVKRLAAKTGGAVNKHVKSATGKPLW